MPVIGHAFVGLGTAMCTRPRALSRPYSLFWTPVVVGLAYLPDVLSQIGSLVAGVDLRVPAHSLAFGVLFSLMVTPPLVKLACCSRLKALVVAAFSILAHDALDLLQATDRQPFWPISHCVVGFDLPVIPQETRGELLLFAVAFCLFALAWTAMRRRRARWAGPAATHPFQPTRTALWAGRVLTLAVLFSALATHYLRGLRQRQAEEVITLLEAHDFARAESVMRQAQRWPRTGKPGRLEYAAAEAWLHAGDRNRAERYYLRACQADPSFFWPVADLAVLYASSGEPVAARRRRIEPLVRRLRTDFALNKALPRVLARIERRLTQPTRATPSSRGTSATDPR